MRRAFTAIELAVILVIIVILAIMILPALDKGQVQARRAKCLGRMRQIGWAMQMYQNAHGGYWPRTHRSVRPDQPHWPDPTGSIALLYPEYAPKPYLFRCPATRDRVAFSASGKDFSNCTNFYVSPDGKAMREQDRGKRPPSPPSYFYDAGSVFGGKIPRDSLSVRVVYGDECVHGYWENEEGEGFWMGENNHPGGGNFLCADKRVEWLEVRWSGKPWDRGKSWPYVPNPRLRRVASPTGKGSYTVLLDTSVFWDDWDGTMRKVDADLAGMMWLDDSWKEF